MSANPLWIFLHLPKSGGTTLKTHLEKHLTWDEELVEFSYWGRQYRQAHGRLEFADRPLDERCRARVLAGHHLNHGIHRLVPGREPRYFTFVRDPAELCVSLYNFRRSRGVTALDFDAWYDAVFLAGHREGMVRFYAERLAGRPLASRPEEHLALAMQLLGRCWHVGTTDRLSNSLSLLCTAISIPADWQAVRTAGADSPVRSPTHPADGERITRFVTLDDATRQRVHADAPCDLALYRWAAERRAPL